MIQEGDPRGELIMVQLAREDRPLDERLAKRESELLASYEPLLGSAFMGDVKVEWRRGFVDSADIHGAYESDEATMLYDLYVADPSAVLTRDLGIGASLSYNGRGDDSNSIFEALRDRPLPHLQRLRLTAWDRDISWTHLGDVSIARLVNLEELLIDAGRVTLGSIDLPRCKRLEIISGGLRSHVLDSIAGAAWPALETLVVCLGGSEYGGTCTLADTRAILAGENLPRVKKLGVCNVDFGDELAYRVVEAKILPQLTTLDLGLGTMGDEGARAFLRNAKRFAHLDVLDLAGNYITADVAAELVAKLPNAKVGEQKTDDQYGRFVSIAE